MMYLIVCLIALTASGLTLFSGFGLGTLLLPAFTLFFPVDVAIAMTAIVHMANNFFKLFLVGKMADRKVLLKFAPPAILAAFLGAWLLTFLSEIPVIASYSIGGNIYQVTALKALIGFLMVGFAAMELFPGTGKMEFDKKYLALGGLVSGFFGGLSGHQGAFRSAFLSKAGLGKEAFIATGVVTAVMIDVTRLSVYFRHFTVSGIEANWTLVVAATVAAFLGAYGGSRLLKKVTFRMVRKVVGVMLVFIGGLLGIGII